MDKGEELGESPFDVFESLGVGGRFVAFASEGSGGLTTLSVKQKKRESSIISIACTNFDDTCAFGVLLDNGNFVLGRNPETFKEFSEKGIRKLSAGAGHIFLLGSDVSVLAVRSVQDVWDAWGNGMFTKDFHGGSMRGNKQIVSGYYNFYLLDNGGTLFGFAVDEAGCGYFPFLSQPKRIFPVGSGVRRVFSGAYSTTTFVEMDDGRVVAGGCNTSGQCGVGFIRDRPKEAKCVELRRATPDVSVDLMIPVRHEKVGGLDVWISGKALYRSAATHPFGMYSRFFGGETRVPFHFPYPPIDISRYPQQVGHETRNADEYNSARRSPVVDGSDSGHSSLPSDEPDIENLSQNIDEHMFNIPSSPISGYYANVYGIDDHLQDIGKSLIDIPPPPKSWAYAGDYDSGNSSLPSDEHDADKHDFVIPSPPSDEHDSASISEPSDHGSRPSPRSPDKYESSEDGGESPGVPAYDDALDHANSQDFVDSMGWLGQIPPDFVPSNTRLFNGPENAEPGLHTSWRSIVEGDIFEDSTSDDSFSEGDGWILSDIDEPSAELSSEGNVEMASANFQDPRRMLDDRRHNNISSYRHYDPFSGETTVTHLHDEPFRVPVFVGSYNIRSANIPPFTDRRGEEGTSSELCTDSDGNLMRWMEIVFEDDDFKIPQADKSIKKMSSSGGASFLLFLDGTLFSCGHPNECGFDQERTKFTEVSTFAVVGERVLDFYCGDMLTAFLTDSGNVYLTGNIEDPGVSSTLENLGERITRVSGEVFWSVPWKEGQNVLQTLLENGGNFKISIWKGDATSIVITEEADSKF